MKRILGLLVFTFICVGMVLLGAWNVEEGKPVRDLTKNIVVAVAQKVGVNAENWKIFEEKNYGFDYDYDTLYGSESDSLTDAGVVSGGNSDSGVIVNEKKESQKLPLPKETVGAPNTKFYFYYNQLTAEEKTAYDTLDQAIKRFESNVVFSPAIEINSFYKMIDGYENENPEIYWIRDYQYYSSEDGQSVTTMIINTPADAQATLNRISQEADRILASRPNSNNLYEMVKYIYETIVHTVEYDENATNVYDIRGSLLHKKSVCAGYAKMFEYLCSKAGIQATYVVGIITDGSGEPHAWNLIKHGGDYAWIDPTWGDPLYFEDHTGNEISDNIDYTYFYATDKVIRKTHSPDTFIILENYKSPKPAWYYPPCNNENLHYYNRYERN